MSLCLTVASGHEQQCTRHAIEPQDERRFDDLGRILGKPDTTRFTPKWAVSMPFLFLELGTRQFEKSRFVE
jgi:hypothetical protein